MTALSVENIVRAGLEASYTAVATAGHTFTNDGKRTVIHVVNGATAMVVTIATPQTSDGLAVADRTVSVGSNEDHFIGPFPVAVYGSTVTVTVDDQSDGTMAVLKVPAE